MRFFKTGFPLLLLVLACQTESEPAQIATTEPSSVVYDSLKAQRYGADDYGMKTYVLALLKQGPNDSIGAREARRLQKLHMKTIAQLAESGKLMLSGPVLGNDPLRGIYVFNVKTEAEARALVQSDPAVQAGVLEMELHPWYGSAALMEIPTIHTTLEKQRLRP